MVSKLGASSRALITAIDAARDGAIIAFLHDGDTEYFRRLTRHLAYIRGVSCCVCYDHSYDLSNRWQRKPNGYEIRGAGQIWFRKTDAIELSHLQQTLKRHRVIMDHRLAERTKAAA